MPKRLAAVLSLIVFSMCLVLGIQASNSFATTLTRALIAMLVTLVLGLILGGIAQAMINENLKTEEEKLKNPQSQTPPEGR